MPKNLIWKLTHLKDFNIRRVPITVINPYTELDRANEVIEYIENNFEEHKFRRTKKNYISKHLGNWGNYYEYSRCSSCIEFVIHSIQLGWCVLQFRMIELDGKKQDIFGSQALGALYRLIPELKNEVCENIQENEEAQQQARIYYNIELFPGAFEGIPEGREQYCGKTLQHVYSLDFRSAFFSALAEIRPQWRERLEEWDAKRKTEENIKQYMNLAIGAMTNAKITKGLFGVEKALSKLRLEILSHHARKFHQLIAELKRRGAIILNLRTDSIKFIGNEEMFKDLPWEGTKLGTWKREFSDCQYRQFSTGKYQWIDENGKNHIKLNGKTKLDNVKPREEWTWDDLEHCGEAIQVYWDAKSHRWRKDGYKKI